MVQKKITYFVLGIFTVLVFHAISRRSARLVGDSNDRVRVDTIYVDRVVKVPGIKEVFIETEPEVKTLYRENPKLLEQYLALESENERLKKYIEAITVRTYENRYVSKDSVVTVTVSDSVTGTLDFQKVKFEVADREVKFREKIIHRTIEKKPDFSMDLGIGVRMPHFFRGSGSGKIDNYPLPSESISFEGVIGFKDKKGYGYRIGVDTRGATRFMITKDLFTKY